MYYNFVRIHQTLRITPAMAAGITDHVWEVSDIVKLLDEKPEKPNYQEDAHYGPALGSGPQPARQQGVGAQAIVTERLRYDSRPEVRVLRYDWLLHNRTEYLWLNNTGD
jgi:hypothetical protein